MDETLARLCLAFLAKEWLISEPPSLEAKAQLLKRKIRVALENESLWKRPKTEGVSIRLWAPLSVKISDSELAATDLQVQPSTSSTD